MNKLKEDLEYFQNTVLLNTLIKYLDYYDVPQETILAIESELSHAIDHIKTDHLLWNDDENP